MSINRFFSYEYFCSANVVVEIEGFPILELSGLQFGIAETKQPLYGYSSRFFDAVARGQVLVQGSILLNYVHQDYLYRIIELGVMKKANLSSADFKTASETLSEELKNQLKTSKGRDVVAKEIAANYPENIVLADALKSHWWNAGSQSTELGTPGQKTPNPHDNFGGIDIVVSFGERDVARNIFGTTAFKLKNVYFRSRSMPIDLGENVIVEEHGFFARNIETYEPTSYISEYIDPNDASRTPVTTTVRNQR